MTQDEIIALAIEAGFGEPVNHKDWHLPFSAVEAFAKLVDAKATARERERISAKNKPEIEKCNAYIKHLELKLQASNVLRGEA
jgi:hypothetical protein